MKGCTDKKIRPPFKHKHLRGLQRSTHKALIRLVQDGTLGTDFAAVEEVEDVFAVYCNVTIRKRSWFYDISND
jgi:hypothetical protein